MAFGLQHEDESITADFILKHASMGTFVELAQAMGVALIAGLPKPKANPQ